MWIKKTHGVSKMQDVRPLGSMNVFIKFHGDVLVGCFSFGYYMSTSKDFGLMAAQGERSNQ